MILNDNLNLPTINQARTVGLALAVCVLTAGRGWGADAPPSPAPPSAPVRLAVLAEDITPETLALADLLTVEITKLSWVETVERAEIERVLAEQTLAIEGLADASTRVHLGRILRAAGLIFVQRETGGDRIVIRLAETRRGFVAGFCMAPAGDVARPAAIAAELRGMLPKLALDLSRQTTVSLLRFTTAMLPTSEPPHPAEGRFESLMVLRLMERLCKEPDIVVTERRRLGDLAQEERLSGEKGDLATGAFLVDGEVATAARLLTPKGDEAVTLTVRIRDLASGTLTPVVLTGARKELDRLVADAVDAAGDALLKDRRTKRESKPLKNEAESLLILARQKGLVWAGEAAYALNPTNQAIRDAYLKALLDQGDVEQPHGAAPRDAYLKVALALARAEQVACEQGISLWAFTHWGNALYGMRHNLEQDITHSDREITQLLRPFRATMRRECEAAAQKGKDPTRKSFGYALLVEWSAALFDTGEERQAFIDALLNRAATDSAWEEPIRDYLVSYLLTQHDWPAKVFTEHGAHADPVRRFYGQYGLMRKTFDPQTQRAHAREALNALEGLLHRPGAFGSYLVLPCVAMTSSRWLSSALQEICARYPEYAPEVTRKLFTPMRELHATGDHRSLYLLEPAVHLRGLPWSEVAPWLDEVAAARVGAPPPEYVIGEMFKALGTLRHEMNETPTQSVSPPAVAARFRRQVLLKSSTVGSAWHLGDGKEELPHYGPGGLQHDIRYFSMYGPQRLLVDGDTLWIGLAGNSEAFKGRKGSRVRHACGLANYHLPTRTLRSTRSGWTETPFPREDIAIQHSQVTHGNSNYYAPLHPLKRWRNWIVMANMNAGITLFPVEPPPKVADLSGVLLLNSEAGLPVDAVYGWTSLGSTLYILVLDQFIMTWNADTRSMAMLFDNMRQITNVSMPEHDKFSIEDLWADEAAQRLHFPGRIWLRHGTRSWSSSRDGPSYLSYHTASAQWTYAKQAPSRPAVAADPRVEARKALQAEGIEPVFDVAVWQGKILALIGYDESWRLELLTEE